MIGYDNIVPRRNKAGMTNTSLSFLSLKSKGLPVQARKSFRFSLSRHPWMPKKFRALRLVCSSSSSGEIPRRAAILSRI